MPERLADVVRALRVGVVVQGPSTELRYCNPAALELLGIDEDQYQGRTSYDPDWNIVREDGTPFEASQRPMAKVLSSGEPVRDVVMGVNRPRRGDRVWLLVNVDPTCDGDGRVVEMVATLIDITARKQLESALLEARKLDSIGRLAAGVAHDFNNLLTVISTATSLAMRRLAPDDRARRELRAALDAAERAGNLTRQLLAFARRREGESPSCDASAVITAMAPLLERVVGTHVVLAVHVASDVGAIAMGASELEQVLLNLAANARDAMPSGGTLRIEAALVIGAEPPLVGPAVRIAVADDGEGMDEVTRARIFEPFFTTKDLGRGTGLGLATVQGVVHQHGGHITVDSTPGRGTRFVIHVPSAGGAAIAGPASPEVARGAETILVAEDEDALRGLVAQALGELGYTVLTACDGADALRVAEAHVGPIHLLLTDVAMPHLSGIRLATALVALRPALRVLVTSGFADERRVPRDSWDVLEKPYTPETLAQRVRAALDR